MSLESLQATIRVERPARGRRVDPPRTGRSSTVQRVRTERDAFESEVSFRQAGIAVKRMEEEMRHAGRHLLALLDYRARFDESATHLDRLEQITERAGQDISGTERSLLSNLAQNSAGQLEQLLQGTGSTFELVSSIDIDDPDRSGQVIREIRDLLSRDADRIETSREAILSELSAATSQRNLHIAPSAIDPVSRPSLRETATQAARRLSSDPLGARRAQAHVPRAVALQLLDGP